MSRARETLRSATACTTVRGLDHNEAWRNANSTAAADESVPSVPTTIQPAGRLWCVARATRTGAGAAEATRALTDPNTRLPSRPRPRDPTTTRWACAPRRSSRSAAVEDRIRVSARTCGAACSATSSARRRSRCPVIHRSSPPEGHGRPPVLVPCVAWAMTSGRPSRAACAAASAVASRECVDPSTPTTTDPNGRRVFMAPRCGAQPGTTMAVRPMSAGPRARPTDVPLPNGGDQGPSALRDRSGQEAR